MLRGHTQALFIHAFLIFIEVVCRIIFYDVPQCGDNMGDHGAV